MSFLYSPNWSLFFNYWLIRIPFQWLKKNSKIYHYRLNNFHIGHFLRGETFQISFVSNINIILVHSGPAIWRKKKTEENKQWKRGEGNSFWEEAKFIMTFVSSYHTKQQDFRKLKRRWQTELGWGGMEIRKKKEKKNCIENKYYIKKAGGGGRFCVTFFFFFLIFLLL